MHPPPVPSLIGKEVVRCRKMCECHSIISMNSVVNTDPTITLENGNVFDIKESMLLPTNPSR